MQQTLAVFCGLVAIASFGCLCLQTVSGLWLQGCGFYPARDSSAAGQSYRFCIRANGCRDSSTVSITQPASTLFANIVDQSNNICSNYCNGDATVRVSGGTIPYTYSWYDAPNLETDTLAATYAHKIIMLKLSMAMVAKIP